MICGRFVAGRVGDGRIVLVEASALVASLRTLPIVDDRFVVGRAGDGRTVLVEASALVASLRTLPIVDNRFIAGRVGDSRIVLVEASALVALLGALSTDCTRSRGSLVTVSASTHMQTTYLGLIQVPLLHESEVLSPKDGWIGEVLPQRALCA